MAAGSLGTAYIDVHARTASFGDELAAKLKAVLKAAERNADSSFNRISASAAKSAKGVASAYRSALPGIANDLAGLANAGVTATDRIAISGATVARSLRSEFGVAAGAVSKEFDDAAGKVTAALNSLSATGRTSLIRLAQTAEATARGLSTDLTAAAQTAATGIQGPLRASIEAIAADFKALSDEGRLSVSDIATAGKIAAAALASDMGLAAGEMTAEIASAAAAISASLAAAASAGGASLSRIAADAAVAAEAAQVAIVAAMNAATIASFNAAEANNARIEAIAAEGAANIAALSQAAADAARAADLARIRSAEITQIRLTQIERAGQAARTAVNAAAGAGLAAPVAAAVNSVAGDLARLAALGGASFGDLNRAASVVASSIQAEFGAAALNASGGFLSAAGRIAGAMQTAAREVGASARSIAAAGAAAAKELTDAFAAAEAATAARLSRLSQQARLDLGRIVSSAQEAAKGLSGPIKSAIDIVIGDLHKLATTGQIDFGDVAAAARAVAREISSSLGPAALVAAGGFDAAAASIAEALEAAGAAGATSFKELQAVASGAAGKIASDFAAASAKIASDMRAAAAESKAALSSIGSSAESGLSKVSGILKNITLGLGATGAAIGFFGFKAAADFERVQVALEGVFGKTDAGPLLRQLQEFANVTPFNFKQVSEFAVRLTALGKTAGQVVPTLKTIGDAVAAVGGTSDNVERVILALTQLKAIGKVNFQDLNQIANALPSAFRGRIFDQFAVDLSKSNAGLALLKKNGLGAADALDKAGKASPAALKAVKAIIASSEGLNADFATESLLNLFKVLPGAEGALERQSKTLLGVLSNFGDRVKTTLIKAFTPSLTPLADALAKISGPGGPIDQALAPIAPRVAKLFTSIVPALGELLPKFGAALGSLFDLLNKGAVPAAHALGLAADGVRKIFDAANSPDGQAGLKALADIGIALGKISIPAVLGVAAAIGSIAQALAPIANLLGDIADSDVGGTIITLGVAFITLNVAIGKFIKIAGIARAAMVGLGASAGAAGAAGGVAALRLALLRVGAALIVLDQLNNQLNKVDGNTTGLAGTVKNAGRDMEHTLAQGIGKPLQGLILGTDKLGQGLGKVFNVDTSSFHNSLQGANTDINGFIGKLGAIPSEITTTVKVVITPLTTEFEKKQTGSSIFTKPLLDKEPGFSLTQDQQDNQRLQREADKAASDAQKAIEKALGGGGGASPAETAAQKAADSFKSKIDAILVKLDAEFRKTLATGSAKAIDTALDSLARSITAAFKGKKTTQDDKLVTFIQKGNTALKFLANERDKIVARLKGATDRAAEVAKSISDFGSITSLGLEDLGKAATDATAKLSDLSHLRIVFPGGGPAGLSALGTTAAASVKADAQKFADALAARLKLIQDFQANIARLIKEGLNKTSIDQIITAGPDAGGGTAKTLAGATQAQIASINASQAAIDKAGKALGNTAADSLFRSGAKITDGLIASLKDKETEINSAMAKIAKGLVDGIAAGLKSNNTKIASAVGDLIVTLVKKVRKDLGIKSPSRVMKALFAHVGTGAAHGVLGSLGHVSDAAAKLAAAAVPNMPDIAAPKLDAASLAALVKLPTASMDVLARIANKGELEKLEGLGTAKLDLGRPLERPAASTGTHFTRDDFKALTKALERGQAPGREIHATVHQTITAHPGQTPEQVATEANRRLLGKLR